MPEYVLDASALLATLFEEPGGAAIEARLENACISAVNLSEVAAKLADRGTPAELITGVLAALDLDIRPFDRAQAERAGILRGSTRKRGLSLGDRACLALAEALERTAVTTDRAWAKLDLGIAVEVAR
jgi:PIN domain nuclease of toxin-antitoxin system